MPKMKEFPTARERKIELNEKKGGNHTNYFLLQIGNRNKETTPKGKLNPFSSNFFLPSFLFSKAKGTFHIFFVFFFLWIYFQNNRERMENHNVCNPEFRLCYCFWSGENSLFLRSHFLSFSFFV